MFDYFAPVFSCGLDIENALAGSQGSDRSVNDVQNEFEQCLENASASALQSGKQESDIELATFAVIAWFDQRIANFPEWSRGCTPLQVTRFNTAHAGEIFFNKLDQLTGSQNEVREVYFVAMGLGFVGRYYEDTGSTGELVRLKEYHAEQLPCKPIVARKLANDYLAPQPYAIADPGSPRIPRAWAKLAVISAAAAGVLLVSGLIMFLLFSKSESVDRAALDRLLSTFDCSVLTADIDGSKVIVAGHVAGQHDIRRLQSSVLDIAGVDGTKLDDVSVVEKPFCLVLIRLDKNFALNTGQGFGLKATPDAGHPLTFKAGERLDVQVAAPNFDAYLYVDYYQRDGRVVHMFPSLFESKKKLRGNGKLVIGKPPLKHDFYIAAPFGQEMVVVLASKNRIFSELRPLSEDAVAYLDALAKQFSGSESSNTVVADYFLVTTEP